jgi:hypothetical protein
VNLHGIFIVGLVILSIIVIGEFFNWVFYEDELSFKELTHLCAALLLSFGAVRVNPFGPEYSLGIINGTMGDNSFHNAHIMAYHSMWPHFKEFGLKILGPGLTVWPSLFMALTINTLLIYQLVKTKKIDITVILLSLTLFLQGMNLSRAGYYFPLASFFLVFYLIYKTDLNIRKAIIPSLGVFFIVAAGVLYMVVFQSAPKYFGFALEDYAPKEEVEFLKKVKLPGPIFNDYVIGGYLTWALYPDYKVFIDPRGGLYMKQVFPDYIEFTRTDLTKEKLDAFNQKYPFKICVLHYREVSLIFRILVSSQGDWRLLYFGKNAAILVHRSLIPVIPDEIKNTKLSHDRFKDVDNPITLTNVFSFYINLNPRAARYIKDTFKKNVSDFYKPKIDVLQNMEAYLMLVESKLQKGKK